jgi:hypothetical protein
MHIRLKQILKEGKHPVAAKGPTSDIVQNS